jgi:hypothetical protein
MIGIRLSLRQGSASTFYFSLGHLPVIAGKVVLTLELGAEGNVENVSATSECPLHIKALLLEKSAI